MQKRLVVNRIGVGVLRRKDVSFAGAKDQDGPHHVAFIKRHGKVGANAIGDKKGPINGLDAGEGIVDDQVIELETIDIFGNGALVGKILPLSLIHI